MPTIQLASDLPLEVAVAFHSPQVAAYRLWYKRPGEARYTIFATGTDDQASGDSAAHTHVVDELPTGSEIVYLVWLSGNASTPYRVTITLLQAGQPVAGAALVLQGITNADGFAQEQDTFTVA